VHLITGGMTLSNCNLSGIETLAGVLEAVRKCRSANRYKSWITGSGWDLPLFKGASPSKELLDQVTPDVPVYLESADGHSAWVNSRALKLSGVGRDTPDPPRGHIERDDKTGEPSGTLRESAMGLVAQKMPPPSVEEYREGLRRGLERANSFGITSIQEANASEDLLRAYRDYDRSGQLSARVVAAIHVDPARGVSQIPGLMRLRQKYRSPRLKADAAKIFVDGVIEAHTAALLSPYLDRPGYSGTPNYSPELLTKLITSLDGAGFQIHIHAIGDRAIRMSLDSFEAAQTVNGKHDARHHIAHLELIDPGDIGRFAKLGVIANFQAFWAYADSYITELTEPVLGPERSRWLYPIKSVVKTGAVVVGGSDWSVTSMNPLDAMQVALTRSPLDTPDKKSWLAEERVDLQTMIAAYTINGAYLSRQEKMTGSVEPGKRADLIVLDQNLFAVPVDAIHKVKVLLTMIDGREVYRDPSFSTRSRKLTHASTVSRRTLATSPPRSRPTP
jgi:predicted amidohydrolase YtcJ